MSTTLKTTKVEFVNRLTEITDKETTGIMSDTFDVFSSSKNEFKGQINNDNFKIKRKRRFFDTNMNFSVANGIFEEKDGNLIVETEINGFNNYFLFFYAFLIIFYTIFIFGVSSSEKNDALIAIPFLVIHGTFMFSIPYFIMKRSVKRMKYELEREFFYLTK